MYYTNAIKVTLKDTESAIKALEILRNRLSAGFAADNGYRRNPSQIMSDALEVADNTIVLPEDFGCYITEDVEGIMFELIQNLAENIGENAFVVENWNQNDYTDGEFEAKYENGLLSMKHIYYPSGFGAVANCEECGEDVVSIEEYEEGKVYVCPECGEVVDLSEYLPITTEKTVQIF